MRHARYIRGLVLVLVLCLLSPASLLWAQADIQTTVQSFLQAWYIDRKSPDALKSFIAKDNGFSLAQPAGSSKGPSTAARVDPVGQLFTGAFASGPSTAQIVRPKDLSEAIELAPKPAARPTEQRKPTFMDKCQTSGQMAICTPEQLWSVKVFWVPDHKPSGKDPLANYLWHLSQAYKGKLYVVVYATKGAGLVREGAVTYWIQEGGGWKLAYYQGTD